MERFITDEMVAGLAEQMRQRAEVDPEFAEDCESIFESKDYIVRPAMGRPEKCEVCGTLVEIVAEASAYDRASKPVDALWETARGRKHTERRCRYWRSTR